MAERERCEPCAPLPGSSGVDMMTEMLADAGDADAYGFIADLTHPRTRGQQAIAEALLDDEDAAELVGMVDEVHSMPDGAAERWGDGAAAHKCTLSLKCLVGLARRDPDFLDNQRQRLVVARE